jgi:hypothetical protein
MGAAAATAAAPCDGDPRVLHSGIAREVAPATRLCGGYHLHAGQGLLDRMGEGVWGCGG